MLMLLNTAMVTYDALSPSKLMNALAKIVDILAHHPFLLIHSIQHRLRRLQHQLPALMSMVLMIVVEAVAVVGVGVVAVVGVVAEIVAVVGVVAVDCKCCILLFHWYRGRSVGMLMVLDMATMLVASNMVVVGIDTTDATEMAYY
jgi:hypothetical protein